MRTTRCRVEHAHAVIRVVRFAFAVAAFADVLRGNPDAASWPLVAIQDMAEKAAGTDPDRKQLVELIDRAIQIKQRTAKTP